ncbi:Outer membrane protein beta-barrel domain-containing protein [Algoriphagus locisalis]|uniref:Outer membrane protein beta-barrel domain-containing protein n=1 Tax=Algoriphagus locisalis TaxID=305507 RepID=A0A1I6ZQ41_9BACT|nr:outer membrane beta-barrel protein [Algoriphagus locisalis]SFT64844.1 Outer membrane protein beta-barrel domain-containing protein [Algoriphagus locisalis]
MKLAIPFVFLLLFLSTLQANAQHKGSGFGLKGGLSYNTSGKYFKDAGSIWKDPGSSAGYQFGAFYKLASYDIFLRPEMVYTHSKFDSGLGEVKANRLDAPVMVGMHLFKLFSIVGGPSFHYILDDNYADYFNSPSDKDLLFGYQFGLGLNFGPVGLDLRYERVLNDQKLNFDQVIKRKEDFRSEQVILGLSYQF